MLNITQLVKWGLKMAFFVLRFSSNFAIANETNPAYTKKFCNNSVIGIRSKSWR